MLSSIAGMKYRKSNRAKQIASGCRNHGTCKVCEGNRLHQVGTTLADFMRAIEEEAHSEGTEAVEHLEALRKHFRADRERLQDADVTPSTRLSKLREIATSGVRDDPSRMARSIEQSMRVEGYEVSIDGATNVPRPQARLSAESPPSSPQGSGSRK